MRFKVVYARLIIANRELRGVRTALLRLVSAILALFISTFGMFLIVAGLKDLALLMALMATGLLSAVLGISALNTLKAVMPILLQRRK